MSKAAKTFDSTSKDDDHKGKAAAPNTNTETVAGEQNKQLANVTQPTTTEQLQAEEQRRKDEAAAAEQDLRDRQARQDAQEKERIEKASEALRNTPQNELAAALIGADDGSKPYGHPDPAPGAAGYEPPKLYPEPGSAEYALAHPGSLTSGMLERDAAAGLPSHDDVRDQKNSGKLDAGEPKAA
jgi:hypothetical protein